MSEEVTSNAAEAGPPGVGEQLVAARERLGLSAGDVARQLRLQLRQVEALEANRFEALPGTTFVRGFLRNYARVVGLDAAALLAAYEASRPQPGSVHIQPPSEQIAFTRRVVPRWVWGVAVAVVVVIGAPLLIYVLLSREPPAAPPPAAPAAPAAGDPLALPPPQEAAQSQAPASEAASSQAPQSGEGAPTATSARGTIGLRFSGDSWVEIRDRSGAKVFSQIGKAGGEHSVEGDPPFEVVVGNAAQVRMTYNGHPVDLAPHVKVNVARFTLE